MIKRHSGGSATARVLLVFMALLLMAPSVASSADPPKVAVFPFDIFSTEPLGSLRNGLQDMLQTRLAKKGWKVIDPALVRQALARINKPVDLSLARKVAGELGADFAVYGSMTKIGSRVSLDAKLLDVLGMQRLQSYFVEGMGLKALPKLTDQLAHDIALSPTSGEKVAAVKVKGNRRIEAAAIKAVMSTKAGGAYSALRLDDDIKAIWKLGYFDNVRASSEDSPDGKVVTISVVEKPTIGEIKVSGNSEVDTEDILDQIDLKVHQVFRPTALKDARRKIVQMYRDKGYYDAKVKTEVVTLKSGQLGIHLQVQEGKKVLISRIVFKGNKAFSDSTLRDKMKTAGSGFLSWLTDDNVLAQEKLEQDVERIADFYYNQGYMDAKVSAPQVSRGKEGLVVTIHVVEGKRYKISSIAVQGEMVVDRKKVMQSLSTRTGQWYSRSNLRKDMRKLNDLYSSRGYAYVRIRPMIRRNPATATVAVVFDIKKGKKVYFEHIVITGNRSTRDKVIRRELGVAEGDLFSGAALRRANMRLHRLNFFEDVHIVPSRGSAPDRMNLAIRVKEKRTGSFMIGGGYSTLDGPMVIGQIQETNLFGRGQRLSLKAQLGGKSTRYTLSFTEPWLFDRPISAGVDIYNWDREYTTYDKRSIGFRVRLGFPTPIPSTRLYTYYKLERNTIDDVDENAALVIRDQAGTSTTSSIRFIVRRDTRNNYFNPTRGSDNSISVEYAGLGGDNAFTKVIVDSGWYIPVWFKHVVVLHGRAGWLRQNPQGNLPIYEKFFLGGINSLRGYDYWDVSPKDPATGDSIGGNSMLQFNLEYRFPILAKAGLIGVVFFDAGNVWASENGYNLGDLRASYGGGIRWYSPLGPLRLEYGRVINPRPGEDTSNWEFTVGSLF